MFKTRVKNTGGAASETTRGLLQSRLLAALGTLAVTAGFLVSSAISAPPARAAGSTADCATMSVIAVRGTDETGNGTGTARNGRVWEGSGYGSKLAPLVNKIRNDNPNLFVNTMGLKYDASGGAIYGNSVNQGRDRLVAELNWIMNSCTTKPMIVLLGYSQGAHVVLNALQSPNLSATAKAQVKAAMVFGDPSYNPKAKFKAPGNGTGLGLFVRSDADTASLDGWKNAYGQYRIRSVCYSYDRWCQKGLGLPGEPNPDTVHGSYLVGTTKIDDAFNWVKSMYAW